MSKYIYTALIVAVLMLSFWLGAKDRTIQELTRVNQAQAYALEMKEKEITRLTADVKLNDGLTLEITKQESEMRSKANEVIKYITIETKQSEPYRANAPQPIIDFLRQ